MANTLISTKMLFYIFNKNIYKQRENDERALAQTSYAPHFTSIQTFRQINKKIYLNSKSRNQLFLNFEFCICISVDHVRLSPRWREPDHGEGGRHSELPPRTVSQALGLRYRRGTSQWATSSYSQPGSQTQVQKGDITVGYLLLQSVRLSDSGIEGGHHSWLPPRTVSQAHRLKVQKGDITVGYLLVQSARLTDSGIERGYHSGLLPRTVRQALRGYNVCLEKCWESSDQLCVYRGIYMDSVYSVINSCYELYQPFSKYIVYLLYGLFYYFFLTACIKTCEQRL